MKTTVTAPKETFIAGRFYSNPKGSVLYVTSRKSPGRGTNIMQFYGVKNSTPSTWLDREADDLISANGPFSLIEEGSTVNIEFTA